MFIPRWTCAKTCWTSAFIVENCPAGKYLWHSVLRHRNGTQRIPTRTRSSETSNNCRGGSPFVCSKYFHLLLCKTSVSVTGVSRLCDPTNRSKHGFAQFAFDEIPIISPDIRFLMTENLLIFFSLLDEPIKMLKCLTCAYFPCPLLLRVISFVPVL